MNLASLGYLPLIIAGGVILLALLAIYFILRSPAAGDKDRVRAQKRKLEADGEAPVIAHGRLDKQPVVKRRLHHEDDYLWRD